MTSLKDIEKLPDTREEFRRYIRLTNSKAVITQQTRDIINTLLDPSSVETDDQLMKLILKFYPVLKVVVVTLTPKEICNLAGLPRSPRKDKFAILLGKLFVRAVSIEMIKELFESRIGTHGYVQMNHAMIAKS